MKNLPVVALFLVIINAMLFACSTDKIKEKINKTGDAAGQVVGEFTSGIASGVDKAIEPKIIVSEQLKSKGISLGKTIISGDSTGTENVLTAYIIFNADFKGTVLAKAYDNKGREMGRIKTDITGKKDEATYVEFRFDRRTDIDTDSELTLE